MNKTKWELDEEINEIQDKIIDAKERIILLSGWIDPSDEIIERLEDAEDDLEIYKSELDDLLAEEEEFLGKMHEVYDRVVDDINEIISPLGLYAQDTTDDTYSTSHYVKVYMQDNDNIRDDYLLTIRLSDHDQPAGGGFNYESQERFGESAINIIVHPNQYDTFKVNEEELLQKIKQEIEDSEAL